MISWEYYLEWIDTNTAIAHCKSKVGNVDIKMVCDTTAPNPHFSWGLNNKADFKTIRAITKKYHQTYLMASITAASKEYLAKIMETHKPKSITIFGYDPKRTKLYKSWSSWIFPKYKGISTKEGVKFMRDDNLLERNPLNTLATKTGSTLSHLGNAAIASAGHAVGLSTPKSRGRISVRVIANSLIKGWDRYVAAKRYGGTKVEGNASDLKTYIARIFGNDALQAVEPTIDQVAGVTAVTPANPQAAAKPMRPAPIVPPPASMRPVPPSTKPPIVPSTRPPSAPLPQAPTPTASFGRPNMGAPRTFGKKRPMNNSVSVETLKNKLHELANQHPNLSEELTQKIDNILSEGPFSRRLTKRMRGEIANDVADQAAAQNTPDPNDQAPPDIYARPPKRNFAAAPVKQPEQQFVVNGGELQMSQLNKIFLALASWEYEQGYMTDKATMQDINNPKDRNTRNPYMVGSGAQTGTNSPMITMKQIDDIINFGHNPFSINKSYLSSIRSMLLSNNRISVDDLRNQIPTADPKLWQFLNAYNGKYTTLATDTNKTITTTNVRELSTFMNVTSNDNLKIDWAEMRDIENLFTQKKINHLTLQEISLGVHSMSSKSSCLLALIGK